MEPVGPQDRRPPRTGKGAPRGGPGRAFLPVLVFVAALLPFLGTVGNGFVAYDDDNYVTGNAVVSRGLTPTGVAWALATFENSNWHPLAWISHMADVTLFGLEPAGHHAVNVLLHALNALLLFLFLRKATGKEWQSAAAVLLFALHPLRVEVVAWVSERKELLCTLFLLLSLHAWLRHIRSVGSGGGSRRLPAVLLFALALASKPMAVTFPFVLLLFDYWPFRRSPWSPRAPGDLPGPLLPAGRLVAEKVPFLLLSGASCLLTLAAQGASGSILPLPPVLRAENALVACASYVWKTAWPASLSVFYPHPGASLPAWEVAAAAAFLAAVTAAALRVRFGRPYLLVGWLFFLGTLVPVSGIVQAGFQAMADRYSYLPSVGLSVALAYFLPSFGDARREGGSGPFSRLPMFVPPLLLAALAAASLLRARDWRDTETLFAAALRDDPRNWVALKTLATEEERRGESARAIRLYSEAVDVMPAEPDLRYNLGLSLLRVGDPKGAEPHFREAVRLSPADGEAWGLLGVALARQDRHEEAKAAWTEALRLSPGNEAARRGLEWAGSSPPPP